MSEHPNEGFSDSRELDALWEIRDERLYLIAVSAYRFEEYASTASVGIRELMPERVNDGRVLADWFSGEFEVVEVERAERNLLRPQEAPPMKVEKKRFTVKNGFVVGRPNQSLQPTATAVTPAADAAGAPAAAVAEH